MKWWILHDVDDAEPWGVLALDDQNRVRRYVPGVGLVYAPGYGDYVWFGELGGHRVDQEQALALINSGWTGTKISQDQLDAESGGDVPVLPLPGVPVAS